MSLVSTFSSTLLQLAFIQNFVVVVVVVVVLNQDFLHSTRVCVQRNRPCLHIDVCGRSAWWSIKALGYCQGILPVCLHPRSRMGVFSSPHVDG